ncbi:MAG TPA: cytochrome P450 [Amycolatopsis sp.]|nr:cytochrome P450 [Amycolatopsis sp.]
MSQHTQSYLSLRDHDPFPFYREQLDTGEPAYWDAGMNAVMVLDHDGCALVQRDEKSYAHPYWDLPGAVEVQGGARQLMMLHGAEHTRVHRFLMRYFSPPVVATYRERYVAPLIARMLGRLAPAGRAELDQQFCERLPAYVICALLGVSTADEELLERCKRWNDDIMRWSETFGEDPEILRDALESARHLADVLLPIIRERRATPQDDFISAIWREGSSLLPDWNERDVLAQARVLLFAGSETTAHLLRNALYHLLEHPDLRRELAAHEDRIDAYVEEVLRYYGVIHFRIRTATANTEVSGCPVHQGDRVHAVLSAANRDSARFDDPDEFRIGRPNVRDHLAFGLGPRMCVGANLARAEAAEAVRQWLTTFPGLEWDTGEGTTPARISGHMPRSYRPIHARWEA